MHDMLCIQYWAWPHHHCSATGAHTRVSWQLHDYNGVSWCHYCIIIWCKSLDVIIQQNNPNIVYYMNMLLANTYIALLIDGKAYYI